MEIRCWREDSELLRDEKNGLHILNVSGDLRGVDVALDDFGVVNRCSVRFLGGPGFAVSSIAYWNWKAIHDVAQPDPDHALREYLAWQEEDYLHAQ